MRISEQTQETPVKERYVLINGVIVPLKDAVEYDHE